MEGKLKYDTIQEYLELYLYPSLQVAVNGLLNEIRKEDFYRELQNDFNQNFFESKAKIMKKEKEMLRLERGSDFSESDYEFLMRREIAMNEFFTESNEIEDEEEDFDPDLDDSAMIHQAEQELNKEEEPPEKKFNPIDYIAGFLKANNLLKSKPQDFDDVIEKEYES